MKGIVFLTCMAFYACLNYHLSSLGPAHQICSPYALKARYEEDILLGTVVTMG